MSVPAMQMPSTMTLDSLLQDYSAAPRIEIAGIASDSRQLQQGFLFLACQGISSHGLDYLSEARAAGVAAVAWDSSSAVAPQDIGVPMIAVENLAQLLGEIANRYYGSPSLRLRTIGVTGTNGKTTVAWMLAQSLQHLQQRCAYLGTLGFGVDELHGAEGMTTPAAVELHGRLATFLDQGATHAAIEVSSHALEQRRVDGVHFDATLFTNLTRDHLDYHGDMNAYFESKALLFSAYPARARIVDIDTPYGEQLAERCGADVVVVSTQHDRDIDARQHVFVRSIDTHAQGSNLALQTSWGDIEVALQLPGKFNVANAALVAAYLLSSGLSPREVVDSLEQVTAPPGRMQRLPVDNAAIYIDYAHTPDALESALQALRPHCSGKLWCVFGCGGDRDTGKRPQMGQVADAAADIVVVTSDNPRGEPAMQIIDQVLQGVANKSQTTVIEDRAAAIAYSIANAAADDVVLIAGKGHENYQEINAERRPFSDFEVALAAAGGAE